MRLDKLLPNLAGAQITLSRRNLEELLGLLNEGKVERPYLYKTNDQYQILVVAAEENNIHYERKQEELE